MVVYAVCGGHIGEEEGRIRGSLDITVHTMLGYTQVPP